VSLEEAQTGLRRLEEETAGVDRGQKPMAGYIISPLRAHQFPNSFTLGSNMGLKPAP